MYDCLLLTACSTAGQLFIYYTISTFGPVVFVIIMTIRQVIMNSYLLNISLEVAIICIFNKFSKLV